MTKNESAKQVARIGGLLVVSGPSGSGKTTICRRLACHDEVNLAVSATTRKKRPEEVDGKDYFFLDRSDFQARVENGEFLEYNEVFGNEVLYGSLKEEVQKGLCERNRYYLMEIDVVGALNLKKLEYKGIYIFVTPPTMEELQLRLLRRGTDDRKHIEDRLKKAEWELDQAGEYDQVIVNDNLEEAISRLERFLLLA